MPPLGCPEPYKYPFHCDTTSHTPVRRWIRQHFAPRITQRKWRLPYVLWCQTAESVCDSLGTKVSVRVNMQSFAVRSLYKAFCGRIAPLYCQQMKLVEEGSNRISHALLAF